MTAIPNELAKFRMIEETEDARLISEVGSSARADVWAGMLDKLKVMPRRAIQPTMVPRLVSRLMVAN